MASKKKPSKPAVKSAPKKSAAPAPARKAAAAKSAKAPVRPAKRIAAKAVTKRAVVAKSAARPAAVVAKPRKGSSKPASKVGSIIEAKPAPAAAVVKTKNGKNPAGLTVKELAYFRDLLINKRRELVGDVSSMEDEALRSSGHTNLSTLPIHMADMGTDNYEQEFTLGLVEKDRNLLRDIQLALSKIVAGTYGICEGTGKPISKARLEAQPWARYSIEHARTLEQRRMRA